MVAVYLGLVLFGVLYAGVVFYLKWMVREDYPATWLTVGGVFGTLVGVYFLAGVEVTSLVFLAFVATGAPSIVGEIAYHVIRSQRDKQQAAETIYHIGGGS
jgi:hypothetical membrane protein